MLKILNKKIFILLIFLAVIFVSLLQAAIDIDLSTVDGKANTERINRIDPSMQIGTLDPVNGIAARPHPFQELSSTMFLWHFNVFNNPDFVDEIESKPLSLTGSITTDAASKTNFFACFYSNGQTEYNLSNNTILRTSLTSGTIEFWFKPQTQISSSLASDQYLIYKGLEAGKTVLTVKLDTNGSLQWINYDGSSDNPLSTNKTTWSDTWYSIALVFNNSSKKIYVNGVLDSSNTITGQIIDNSNNFLVGGRGLGANDSFQGYFDELRISDTNFDDDQIFANYYQTAYKYSNDNGTSWTNWTPLSYSNSENSDKAKTQQSVTLASGNLSFISSPSGYTNNVIQILATNILNEYTTEQFTIKIDTLAPNNILDFSVTPSTSTAKRFALGWTAVSDLPIDTDSNISSYRLRVSTVNFNSLGSWALWEAQSSSMTVSPANVGVQQTLDYDGVLKETTYYFTIRAYDGVYYSTYTLKNALSSGINNITDFQGTAISDTEIKWAWTDNSTVEQYFDIYDQNYNLIVSSLTANTTYYTETNLQGSVQYVRRIKARNAYFATNFSSTTATTLSFYNKDIDGDGFDEYFVESTNSLLDDYGAKISVLNKCIGKKIFFYVKDVGSSATQNYPDFVWLVDEDYVSDVKIEDVNGDGISDYLYKSKGNSEYDRIFNVSRDVDTDFGTIKGIVYDQTENALASVPMIIYTSLKTVEATTDSNGAFEITLPITYGEQTKITIEKDGYERYEQYFDFVNGEENLKNITITSYELNQTRDDIHNYPNPFLKGKNTTMLFNVKNSGVVKVYVHNVKGQVEKKIFDGYKSAGIYEIVWDGKGDNGDLGAGLYYIIYKTKDSKIVKKMVIK